MGAQKETQGRRQRRHRGKKADTSRLLSSEHTLPHSCTQIPPSERMEVVKTRSPTAIVKNSQVAERLQQSEERFRNAFESAAIGMALVAPDGRFMKVNAFLSHIVGYAQHELLDMNFQSITHPDDLEQDLEIVRQLFASDRRFYEREKRYIHKRGSTVWVRLHLSLIRDTHGAPLYFISQIQDITERRRAEHKLRENERLAAMGATTAKLVHEIGNPLNGMYTSVQLLERDLMKSGLTPDDLIFSTIHDLSSEIHRLRSLLLEFRSLARPQQLDLQPTALAILVAELLAVEAVEYTAQGIQIEQAVPSDLPLVLADQEKLKQVLLNLCKNALEAMSGGGTLSVRGDVCGEQVRLEVADTGSGVPADVDIFDLFTTTKRDGMGLGLAIVRQIVIAHDWTITYSSEPGQGTIFRILLTTETACHPFVGI